jgi:hypothetical protein
MLKNLWEEIVSSGPNAKPIWESVTFWGWALTFVFFSLYLIGIPPETASEWINALAVAAGNATVLIATLRRQDIKVVENAGA